MKLNKDSFTVAIYKLDKRLKKFDIHYEFD